VSDKIPFVKMHGLGNDFVIIENKYLLDYDNLPQLVTDISNRRLGVGCDQFILYEKNDHSVKMYIYNQDGSSAKACGNASRCLSRLMFDRHGLKDIVLDVSGRKVVCKYFDRNNIQVNMGQASFDSDWMPDNSALWEFVARYGAEPKESICVDVANPHLVIFTKLKGKDQRIIAENLQKTDLFKAGVNVNFAAIEDNNIILKVWERGAGFTLACGSGACATFAAANKLGFIQGQAVIKFALGQLSMSALNQDIILHGSASYVFTGEYCYE
jgi:diaminopimelate epimerase